MIDPKEPTRDEITRVAYALYLLRGCGHGRDVEDWVAAEKELSDEPVKQPQTTTTADAAGSHVRPVWFE